MRGPHGKRRADEEREERRWEDEKRRRAGNKGPERQSHSNVIAAAAACAASATQVARDTSPLSLPLCFWQSDSLRQEEKVDPELRVQERKREERDARTLE